MTENPKPNEANDPQEPLSPVLRDAVAEILARPVPEELSRRVLDAVRQQAPRRTRRPIRRLALVAFLAAAASIGVVLLGWHLLGSRLQSPILGPSVPPVVAHEPAPADPLPTLWAYRQAAKESPEALETLLDRHARQLLSPEPEPLRAGFPPSSAGGVL